MTKDPSDESGEVLCQKMDLKGDGAEFTVDALECTYELSEGGNILVLTTDGIRILGSMAEQEPVYTIFSKKPWKIIQVFQTF